MNKVVNINVNGFIFTIDEVAYEVLKQYLDSLSTHFKGKEGAAEIISDIETRIAELLQHGITSQNPVVQLIDVKKVIELMGEPWQIDGEESTKEQTHFKSETPHEPYKLRRDPTNKVIGGVCGGIANYLNVDPIIFRLVFAISFFIFGSGFLIYIILWLVIPKAKQGELNNQPINGKRLFRDTSDKRISGVCGGLGYYFGIDPVWFRIGFLLAFFIYGTGLMLYIVLWIALPKAVTAAEKLQMKGEPVDINNIERVVKNSFPKAGDQINRAGSMLTEILRNLFNFMGRFVGFVFFMIGIFILFILLMVSLHHKDVQFFHMMTGLILNEDILFYARFGSSFMLISVGLIVLFIGSKLLFRLKFKTRVIYLFLVAAFMIGCVFQGLAIAKFAYKFNSQATKIEKAEVAICPDTLYLQTTPDDSLFEEKKWNINYNNKETFALYYSESDGSIALRNQKIHIIPSRYPAWLYEVVKTARGSSKSEASQHASALNFKINVNDSLITFNNGIIYNAENPFYFQNAKVNLRLPYGAILKVNNQVNQMLLLGNEDAEDGCSIYRVNENGIECIQTNNETSEADEDNDDEEVSININSTNEDENDTGEVTVDIHGKNKNGIHTKKTIVIKNGKKVEVEESQIGPIKVKQTKEVDINDEK